MTSDDARHDGPGVVSMANTGVAMSESSEFFITFAATKWLDGKHTVIGHVVDGMEAVRALEKHGSRGGKPTESLAIRRAWVSVE